MDERAAPATALRLAGSTTSESADIGSSVDSASEVSSLPVDWSRGSTHCSRPVLARPTLVTSEPESALSRLSAIDARPEESSKEWRHYSVQHRCILHLATTNTMLLLDLPEEMLSLILSCARMSTVCDRSEG